MAWFQSMHNAFVRDVQPWGTTESLSHCKVIQIPESVKFSPVECGTLGYWIRNSSQVPVAQTLDGAIHRINNYPAGENHGNQLRFPLAWIQIYPVDSAIHLLNNWGLTMKSVILLTIGILEFGIQETGYRVPAVRNPQRGIQNPTLS